MIPPPKAIGRELENLKVNLNVLLSLAGLRASRGKIMALGALI
jgi:hypothetical protein